MLPISITSIVLPTKHQYPDHSDSDTRTQQFARVAITRRQTSQTRVAAEAPNLHPPVTKEYRGAEAGPTTDLVAIVDAESVSPLGPASRSTRIARNTLINVIGGLIPLILSLATVPAYLYMIGEVRYGILAVLWVVLGYFGVFDLGLSRATSNQIARMGNEPAVQRERVFWTALSVNATVGAVGGIALFLVGHLVLSHVLKVSPALRGEAIDALPWLALAVPLTTITLVLGGTLEGRERFLTINLLTIFGLVLFQVAPLGYAYWVGTGLAGLVMVATLALAASAAVSLVVTAASLPVSGRPRIDLERVRSLVTYGGWITVSGLVSPILTLVDRIVIGAVLGAKSVTRYTIPFTLVSRAVIVPTGFLRTLFPRFSMLDRHDAAELARVGLRALVALMTPLTVFGLVILDPFLRTWVGDEIGRSSAPVGEILLLGIWLNSLAMVPYALLQAQRRPDLPAKFHLFEVAPYIGGLALGLHLAGIRGAAWAWTGRAAVDAILLFWAARATSAPSRPVDLREIFEAGLVVLVACICSLTLFANNGSRIVIGIVLMGASLWIGWRLAAEHLRGVSRAIARAWRQ